MMSMRIGYFTSEFPYIGSSEINAKKYVLGGVGRVAYNLALQMSKRGHEIFVFASSEDSKNSVEKYNDITIYRYGKNFTIGQAPISMDLLYKPLLSGLDLDIVHTHMGNLPAPLTGYWYAKMKKKPLVISYHGDSIGGFGGMIRRSGVYLFNKYFCDKLLSGANIIIALSEQNLNESNFLKKYYKKIKIVTNGIDLKDFDILYSKEQCKKKLELPFDKIVILYVGNLTFRKGPQELIKAMKIVLEKVNNAYLILVGEGALKKNLIDYTKELGLENQIRFAGYVTEFDKKMYYRSSDMFVLPSLSESFGLVLLEASAFGLPLIVSDLASFEAVVENRYNGLRTKICDPKDLSDKIIYLITDDRAREEMGKNARTRVENPSFSWENIARNTEEIYKVLLSGRLNKTTQNEIFYRRTF